MNTETNFMSFENLTKLIEEHKKETHPYKKYEFDSTSYTLLLISINNLIKENQELKSQLKGTTHCFDEEEHEKLKKQLEELKEEKQEWINLLAMFKNQQKEFIKWLEDYLKLFDNMCIDEQGYYDMLEEILQKYKNIIGDDK